MKKNALTSIQMVDMLSNAKATCTKLDMEFLAQQVDSVALLSHISHELTRHVLGGLRLSLSSNPSSRPYMSMIMTKQASFCLATINQNDLKRQKIAIASAQLSKVLKRATFHTSLTTHSQSKTTTTMDVADKAGPTMKRYPYRILTDEGSSCILEKKGETT